MDSAALVTKIFWNLQQRWHLRRQPDQHELSVKQTVKGLQTLLLAEQGALLAVTLRHVFARPVSWHELARLDIGLYQEGAEQRVWRARVTLADGTTRPFGLIAARDAIARSAVTQRDFCNLQTLHKRQARYCVAPYACGVMPVAGGATAYTVEWLDQYKELVFEITHDGGVFLVNARGAHHHFSPLDSRYIWRRIVEILCCYPDLQAVNIQAGDFVGHRREDGQIELKITTARELTSTLTPMERIHTIIGSVITASGYLSDGRSPFDRHMTEEVFLHRIHAVLRRRFGDQAAHLARKQWTLFQHGVFAQQEDRLKEDCVLATYDHLRQAWPATLAWRQTSQRWMAYAKAVQDGQLPPSWWFPATEIPAVLDRLAWQSVLNNQV